MRVILIIGCLFLSACSHSIINCPAWVETGTISLDDTEQTKRWMYRFETNRQRECGK